MQLKRGDLVEVHWVDITEDPVGDLIKADVFERVSIGYFWEIKRTSHCASVLVTTTTLDSTIEQSGWCAYPIGCVQDIRIIRKGKGKVYRAQPVHSWDESERDGNVGTGQHVAGDSVERGPEAGV